MGDLTDRWSEKTKSAGPLQTDNVEQMALLVLAMNGKPSPRYAAGIPALIDRGLVEMVPALTLAGWEQMQALGFSQDALREADDAG